MSTAFGGILVVDGTAPQTVGTDASPNSAVKLHFRSASGVRGSEGCVVEDVANDQIKLGVGCYKVDFHVDFDCPATIATYKMHVYTGPALTNVLAVLSKDIQSYHDVPLITETQGHCGAAGFFEITTAQTDANGFAAVALFVECSAEDSSSSSTTNSSSSSSSTTNSSSSSSSTSNSSNSSSSSSNSSSSSSSNSSSSSSNSSSSSSSSTSSGDNTSSSSNSSSSSSSSSSNSSSSNSSSSSSTIVGGNRITVRSAQLNVVKVYP